MQKALHLVMHKAIINASAGKVNPNVMRISVAAIPMGLVTIEGNH